MAANNYFGFTQGTSQYAAAAGTPAYQAPQPGYVAHPAAAAAAATYTTQRAPGYEYQAAAQPATYAVGASGAAGASGYDYASYARTAPAAAAYDTSKSYYQQGAAPATPAYTSADYQGNLGSGYSAATYTSQQGVRPAGNQHKAGGATAQYSTGYAATQPQPQAQPPTYTYSTPQSSSGASFNGSTVSYTNTNLTTNHTSAYLTQQTTPQPTAAAKPKAAVYSGAMYMNQGGAGGAGNAGTKTTTSVSWQGFKKSVGVKQSRPKPTPKPQQLHYCEVCKISCAGPQTYREHLEGQRHKKKEQLQKEGGVPVGAGRGQNNLRCELCDVVCTGSDAYAAHLRGAKHLKVVKLHTRLGKPIPEVDVKAAKAAAVAAAAGASAPSQSSGGGSSSGGGNKNISFIQSGTLGTVKSGDTKEDENRDEGMAQTEDSTNVAASACSDVDMGENEITPVGQEYIEELKSEEGKLLSFVCKLCECKFNDPNAKDMHMKGRRHRLQFKKKVNPELVVDVKPSGRRSRVHEEKNKRRDTYMWRREDDRSFWTDRLDDRIYWEERRRFEEEVEYMEWMRRRGPAPGPNFIQPPFAMRRPETIDDRHIAAKHQTIFPKDDKLQIIHKMANQVEKAIRTAADQIGPKLLELVKKETTVKDDKGTGDKKPDEKGDDKEVGRVIRGVMRVGILAKNLILADDSVVQLVILCNDWPTKPILQQLYAAFQTQMKNSCPEENYLTNLCIADACFSVATTSDPKVQVIVSMTSPVVRETLLKEEASGSSLVKNEEALDEAKCLEALAQLRRAKWFQARPGNNPSSVMVIRILRDLCSRNPTWGPLTDWACELLVDRVVGCVAFSGSEALRKVLEAVAGGVLLPIAPGIADPCERDPTDAAADLTLQQRADITASAQHALRLFAFRQIHKVLGMAQITPVGRHMSNRPHPHMQRFNRKRRRDHSTGENHDSEGADGKKDKKDGEGDIIMSHTK